MSSHQTPSKLPERRPPSFGGRLFRRIAKGLATLALLAVIAVVALFFLLWRDHRSEISLLVPTGHFAVGRSTFTSINEAEMDELAPSPRTKRVVVAWMWYPASATSKNTTPAEYLACGVADCDGAAYRHIDEQISDATLVRTHRTSDPDVSPEQRSYP
jgi:hypothetical protein